VIAKRRRLPHFDSIGYPQFVTFRLHGSLPANRPFRPADTTSGEAFAAMDKLLVEARSGPTFLKQTAIAELVRASILYGADVGHYEIHSWVIMANHVHLLITPRVGLSQLLCSLKTATATRANLLLHRTGQPFWQDECYDHLVRSGDEFRRIQRYIENNPVKACLASSPEDYVWSSAWRPERVPQAVSLPHWDTETPPQAVSLPHNS
jgi:REP element-mobilizing transposase RayT